jgi:hypothetical protein
MNWLRTASLRLRGGSYLPSLCASGGDSVGCLNAISDPQAMQFMLSALFAFVLHASQQKTSV